MVVAAVAMVAVVVMMMMAAAAAVMTMVVMMAAGAAGQVRLRDRAAADVDGAHGHRLRYGDIKGELSLHLSLSLALSPSPPLPLPLSHFLQTSLQDIQGELSSSHCPPLSFCL
jgi:hypothetical protein